MRRLNENEQANAGGLSIAMAAELAVAHALLNAASSPRGGWFGALLSLLHLEFS
jgi:hypothetical protein